MGDRAAAKLVWGQESGSVAMTGFSKGRGASAMALLAGTIFVAGAFVPAAEAADPTNRIQLQVFQVKVVDTKGQQGQMPVGVYIDTPNRKASTDVCSLGPRLRDALNTYLRKETYQLDAKGNLQDTARMGQGARPIIENQVKAENVVGVEVKQGAPTVKASAAAMFQKSGCIGVADANEDSKAKSKGGEAKEGGGH
jgi:hypothetical protein